MREVILHHSLTKDGEVKDFDAIKKYHVENNGWLDIGYHMVLEYVNGSVKTFLGRPKDMQGAHTLGHNEAYGVCLVGNFDKGPPSDEMMTELYKQLDQLEKDFNGITISGHRDYSYKTCPGKLFPLDEVKKRYEYKNKFIDKRTLLDAIDAFREVVANG